MVTFSCLVKRYCAMEYQASQHCGIVLTGPSYTTSVDLGMVSDESSNQLQSADIIPVFLSHAVTLTFCQRGRVFALKINAFGSLIKFKFTYTKHVRFYVWIHTNMPCSTYTSCIRCCVAIPINMPCSRATINIQLNRKQYHTALIVVYIVIGRLPTDHITANAAFTYRTTHIIQGLQNCVLNWGRSQLVACFDAYQHAMLNLHQPRQMLRCDTDQHAMLTGNNRHLDKSQAIPYGPHRRVHHDRSSACRTSYGECGFYIPYNTYQTAVI